MFCAGCRACAGVAAETPAARRGLACPHYRVVGSCLAVKSAACAHVGCARIQACVCMCERVSLCVLQGCLGCQAARISGGGCGPARVLQLLWKRTVGHAQGLEKFVLSLWVCCVMSTCVCGVCAMPQPGAVWMRLWEAVHCSAQGFKLCSVNMLQISSDP